MPRVIVVGAGAAGLMAAGKAAEQGAETMLLEKMHLPGRKLRITGKGRCNLTNNAHIDEFEKRFGTGGKFLRPAFRCFSNQDLIRHLADLGVPTEVQRGGRVFPASQRAQDVLDALYMWNKRNGVRLKVHSPVQEILVDKGNIKGVSVRGSYCGQHPDSLKKYWADAVILATGGASYPATGSSGEGYRLASSVGHDIVPIYPGLVPVEVSGLEFSKLQGLNLLNVKVLVWINGRKRAESFGEVTFTDFGLSGPVILSLSAYLVNALQQGKKVEISIDFKPALDLQKLNARLLRDLNKRGGESLASLMRGLLPGQIISLCLDQTGLSQQKRGSQVTSSERKRLVSWLKEFRMEISGHRPFTEALITMGGVSRQQVNPRSMESKLVKGLYFAGEILDLAADSGGYNLQAAFSTGWLAGLSSSRTKSVHEPITKEK